MSRPVLIAVLVAVLLGCSGPAPQAPPAAPDIVAEAVKAFERSDWVSAARLLRQAVTKEPSNLALHYYLAITASHLDLIEEAVREFQWVLGNAPETSTEAQTARKWLTDAGRLGRTTTATAATTDADAPVNAASLHGQIVWPEGQPPLTTARRQLFLKGLGGTPTVHEFYSLRTDQEGRFSFTRVAPGAYKLMDRIAGGPTWRLRVQLEPSQDMALDLTPQNSVKNHDDFPQDGA
jgi:tetratricopeptide repeat protein